MTVIIPARNEPYLSKTVDDLFAKAAGEIEIITILDGYWPNPPLISHKNLIQIHRGEAKGMREATNIAVEIAKGKFIMKVDAHCMFGEGWDEILIADCKPDWLCVPTRYRLDTKNWGKKGEPINYLYLTYPYINDDLYGPGFHGRKWVGKDLGKNEYYRMENERKDILLDEIIAFQGSCWFMHKQLYFDIGKTDPVHYNFFQEAQELGFKVWLSGGAVMRNKKTWYAHWHKTNKEGGRFFWLSKQGQRNAQHYSADFWMNNKWDKRKRDIEWLIDKFSPMPEWPEDWKTCRI